MVCARVIGVCSSLSCSLDFDRVPTPRHHSLPPCHQSSSRLKTSTFCTSALICRQKSEGRGFVGWGSLVCSNCSFWDAQHRGSPRPCPRVVGVFSAITKLSFPQSLAFSYSLQIPLGDLAVLIDSSSLAVGLGPVAH